MTILNQILSRLSRRLAVVAGELPFDQAAGIGAYLDPLTGVDHRLKVDALMRFLSAAGSSLPYGVPVRVPVETSDAIGAAGEICSFVPLRPEVRRVELVAGAAAGASTSGNQRDGISVSLTFQAGVTTFAGLEAALAASPAPAGAAGSYLARSALALRYTAPGATVIATGFAWRNLYDDAPAAPLSVRCTRREDGLWVPDTLDTSLETIYESPADVAVAAAATLLTPWIDVEPFAALGAFVSNNAGVNPISGVVSYWAPNADGTGYPGVVAASGVNAVVSINNNASSYLPLDAFNSVSASTLVAPGPRYRGLRVAATSPLGAQGRITVLGRRVR